MAKVKELICDHVLPSCILIKIKKVELLSLNEMRKKSSVRIKNEKKIILFTNLKKIIQISS